LHLPGGGPRAPGHVDHGGDIADLGGRLLRRLLAQDRPQRAKDPPAASIRPQPAQASRPASRARSRGDFRAVTRAIAQRVFFPSLKGLLTICRLVQPPSHQNCFYEILLPPPFCSIGTRISGRTSWHPYDARPFPKGEGSLCP